MLVYFGRGSGIRKITGDAVIKWPRLVRWARMGHNCVPSYGLLLYHTVQTVPRGQNMNTVSPNRIIPVPMKIWMHACSGSYEQYETQLSWDVVRMGCFCAKGNQRGFHCFILFSANYFGFGHVITS
jgi:hypothetical protein